MSVRITPTQLIALAEVVREQGLTDLPAPLELRNGYDGSMKEHDACVRLKFEGTETEIALVRRYGA